MRKIGQISSEYGWLQVGSHGFRIHHKEIISLGVIDTLRDFISQQKMQDWLIKFDIILNDDSYVVLDIGMDPPSRMLKESKENKIDFEKYYVAQYLLGKVEYPHILD